MALYTRREFINTTAKAAGTLLGYTKLLRSNPDVLVLGAGIAGLHAAMLLENKGYKVQVLEANTHVGGRMAFTDMQASQYFKVYRTQERIMKLAEQMGLTLEDEIIPDALPMETLLYIGGQSATAEQWKWASTNPIEADLKHLAPFALGDYILQKNFPFKNLYDWIDPQYAYLDISYYQFLKNKGLSDESIRFTELNAHFNSADNTSALHVLRRAVVQHLSKYPLRMPLYGNPLPQAMQASLKTEVHFRKNIASILNSRKGVNIRCTDGSTYSAQFAICTLPFSTLRRIRLGSDTHLNPLQQEAITQLPYTAITDIHLYAKRDFWQEDGGSLFIWSDALPGLCMPVYSRQGRVHQLLCRLSGQMAIAFDSNGRAQHIIDALAAIRPASAGALEVLKVHSWQKNPFTAGAFHEYAPGQVNRWARHLAQPIGNLFFTGEHTNLHHTGLEGTLQSVERAIQELSLLSR